MLLGFLFRIVFCIERMSIRDSSFNLEKGYEDVWEADNQFGFVGSGSFEKLVRSREKALSLAIKLRASHYMSQAASLWHLN